MKCGQVDTLSGVTGLYSSRHQLVLRVPSLTRGRVTSGQVIRGDTERAESRDLDSKLEVTAGSQLLLLFHSMVIQLENCELVGS